MWRIVKRLLCLLTIALFSILVGQIIYFMKMLVAPAELKPADVIVSFEGRDERARTAYALADQCFAPALIISPANQQRIDEFDRKYLPKKNAEKIIEEKARTTFENALYASSIVKRNDYASVVLVTSWDHMPRSIMLLKLMLMDSDVRIFPVSVPTGELNNCNWWRHRVGWKMTYNEMVKCWGSLIELVIYRANGKLLSDRQGGSSVLTWLKKSLLLPFDYSANGNQR